MKTANEKKYRITFTTNPYFASKYAGYKECEILQWNGATPVKWVHDDNFGFRYTF